MTLSPRFNGHASFLEPQSVYLPMFLQRLFQPHVKLMNSLMYFLLLVYSLSLDTQYAHFFFSFCRI